MKLKVAFNVDGDITSRTFRKKDIVKSVASGIGTLIGCTVVDCGYSNEYLVLAEAVSTVGCLDCGKLNSPDDSLIDKFIDTAREVVRSYEKEDTGSQRLRN